MGDIDLLLEAHRRLTSKLEKSSFLEVVASLKGKDKPLQKRGENLKKRFLSLTNAIKEKQRKGSMRFKRELSRMTKFEVDCDEFLAQANQFLRNFRRG